MASAITHTVLDELFSYLAQMITNMRRRAVYNDLFERKLRICTEN